MGMFGVVPKIGCSGGSVNLRRTVTPQKAGVRGCRQKGAPAAGGAG